MRTNEKLYTTNEVAKILRCHSQTIRRKIRQRKIKAIFSGKNFLIKEEWLQNYLDSMSL